MNNEQQTESHTKEKNNEYYKRKYKLLRRTIVEVVHQNAALCSELSRTEEKVNTIKLERKYLMKKLMQYEKPKMDNLKSSGKPKSESTKGKSKTTKGKKSQSSNDGSGQNSASLAKTDIIKVKPIQVDQNGRPIFPIEIGSLSIYSIGEIVNDRPHYHTNKCIFPVGYCSTRLCSSVSSADQHYLYTCKILDDGYRPRFEISPEDSSETIFSGHTVTDVYSNFLSALGSRLHNMAEVSALDFFGLSHPIVQNLIQSLPGACRCSGYEWKKIEIVQPGNREAKAKPKSRVRQSDINIEALEKWARDT